MVQATASVVQAALARVAMAEAAMFKAGQVLQGLVLGTSPDGLTALKIGDLVVKAELPQPMPAGTSLTLQVKTGGASPQLVVVRESIPPATASPPSPMPQAALEMLPEIAVQPEIPESNQPAAAQSLRPESAPAARSRTVAAPAPVAETAQGGPSQVQPQAGAKAPVPTPPQSPAATTDTVADTAPLVPPAGGATAPAGTAIARPAVQAPVQGEEDIPAGRAASAAMPPQTMPSRAEGPSTPAAVRMEAPVGTGAAAPQPARTDRGFPAPPPASTRGGGLPAETAVPPAVSTAAAGHGPDGPLSTTVAARTSPVGPAPVVAAPTEEPPSPSPLLLAQSAARPAIATPPPSALPTPGPVPSAAPQPTALPQAVQPPTPQAALSQMMPAAMANQDSLGPLLQSLAAVIVRPAILPEPVLRAALQVLGLRVAAPAEDVAPEAIERAVARSGLYLEALLAKALPAEGDGKAALLGLKAALEKWVGSGPGASPGQDRAAPPLRGLPLRAVPLEAPNLPEQPRDVGRLLHEQTDAALSRIKLGQLAALPDSAAPRTAPPELRLELPLLIGQQLVMAQLQVVPDGARRESGRRRGWTIRFAMHLPAAGDVGAEVGVLGKSVNIGLWAADPEMAERLSAGLPELAGVLAESGLTPGAIRVRHGLPETTRPPAGQLLDSVS